MTEWDVSFKVTGTFSAKVKANSQAEVEVAALKAFLDTCKRATENERVTLNFDPEPGTANTPALLEVAMRKAGVPRVDWRAVEELLSVVEGDFPFLAEKEAFAVIKAAVFVASQYPESQKFQAALASVRNQLALNKVNL